jgi:hypothetical protein
LTSHGIAPPGRTAYGDKLGHRKEYIPTGFYDTGDGMLDPSTNEIVPIPAKAMHENKHVRLPEKNRSSHSTSPLKNCREDEPTWTMQAEPRGASEEEVAWICAKAMKGL